MGTKLTTEQLNSLPHEALVLMFQQLQANVDDLKAQNDKLMLKIDALQESLAVSRTARFGRSTEKSASIPGQMAIDFEHLCIVNEAELLVEGKVVEEPKPEDVLVKRPKTYQKRADKLASIPATVVPAQELSEEELKELFPNGYIRMEDETYTEIEMIPTTFLKMEYHVAVYKSHPDANGNVEFVRGPRKGRLFGSDSLATPSMLAGIINGKYGNANPLNRLSNAFLEKDLKLSPQVLAKWCIWSAERYFQPLFELMHQEMVEHSRLIHADESFFKVTQELQERGSNAKSYMWLYHTDVQYGSHSIFLYEYTPTRHSENPNRFLKGFKGTLLTDGYTAYHKLANENSDRIRVAGCWSHAKRRYANLLKASSAQRAKGTVAYEANERIAAIFHVDKMYKDLPPEERLRMRQTNVKPLVEAFFEYLKNISPALDKSSETAKAVNYCLNQEPYLKEFLNDPIVPLDNNDAERSIRTFCVGRKNWNIINSKGGAKASGILLSMTETAKANNLKVFNYLTYVLEQMKEYAHAHLQKPTEMSFEESFLRTLLPWSDQLPDECRMQPTKPSKA